MNHFSRRSKWLIGTLALLTMFFIGLGIHCSRPPAPPPAEVVFFPLPYHIPNQKVPLPDRWIPRSWGWAWHLKQAVLGRAKSISIRTAVFAIAGQEASALADHPPRPPAFVNTNGLRIWILPEGVLAALRGDIEQTPGYHLLTSAGITTSDGGQAQMFSGNAIPVAGSRVNVGLVIEMLPRVRSVSTDLTTVMAFSESVTNQPDANPASPQTTVISVRTNFAAAVRIQIPKGSGVLLLDASGATTNEKTIGVIISATMPKPKK
jgi:hypothetical protein